MPTPQRSRPHRRAQGRRRQRQWDRPCTSAHAPWRQPLAAGIHLPGRLAREGGW